MYRKALISCQALLGLVLAWMVKSSANMQNVHLSPFHGEKKLNEGDIVFVVHVADLLVRLGAVRTGRKCFFRTFIMATVLRRWGVTVIINVGLANLKWGRKASGHCWLTVDGLPIAEQNDPTDEFPYEVGRSPNGVRYWAGANETI